ncbi:MAG: hypothetical protein ACRDVC_09040 [Acidimicrobiales bacterium]
MRRQIPYALLGVLVIVAGVFALVSYQQSTASGSSTRLLLPCVGGPTKDLAVKPSTYVISCADANSEYTDLHWSGWGDETAYATGEARWNDCTPTCVAGHWRSEPVTLWVWDPRSKLFAPHLKISLYTRLESTDPRLLDIEIWGINGGGYVSSSSSPPTSQLP